MTVLTFTPQEPFKPDVVTTYAYLPPVSGQAWSGGRHGKFYRSTPKAIGLAQNSPFETIAMLSPPYCRGSFTSHFRIAEFDANAL
jgi:hypothetical protein